MTFRFSVRSNSELPIFAQIVRQTKEGIARGVLRSGEQLPTVRDLARELLVNPNTVAKAYQELERSGILETRRGAGSFVSGTTCTLSPAEREKIFVGKVRDCLTEAVHLDLARPYVRERFERTMKEYRWPGEES